MYATDRRQNIPRHTRLEGRNPPCGSKQRRSNYHFQARRCRPCRSTPGLVACSALPTHGWSLVPPLPSTIFYYSLTRASSDRHEAAQHTHTPASSPGNDGLLQLGGGGQTPRPVTQHAVENGAGQVSMQVSDSVRSIMPGEKGPKPDCTFRPATGGAEQVRWVLKKSRCTPPPFFLP